MRVLPTGRYAASIAAAAALVSGCGQPPSGAPKTAWPQRYASSGYEKLYSFRGGADGYSPVAGLVLLSGTLYGTTQFGGAGSCYMSGASGCGTIFAIEPSGEERVVYQFQGGSDGAYPLASLIVQSGALYGTTAGGGNAGCDSYSGCGTIFKVGASGQESVIYRFGGEPDGAAPRAPLTFAGGKFVGTTSAGGANDGGTVFVATVDGEEKVLASFEQSPNGGPYAGLLPAHGAFYGTTLGGGAFGAGTAFAVTMRGSLTLLHSFGDGTDGSSPSTPLVSYGGVLYGTSRSDGITCGCGAVFTVSLQGKERVIFHFGGTSGSTPYAGLTAVGHTFYGTTELGGAHDLGTIFAITPTGRESVMYSFGDSDGDGSFPTGGLLYWNGALYGTTSHGGANGAGTVFEFRLR